MSSCAILGLHSGRSKAKVTQALPVVVRQASGNYLGRASIVEVVVSGEREQDSNTENCSNMVPWSIRKRSWHTNGRKVERLVGCIRV